MRFLITFLCIAFVGHVEAALDMPLKFGDLGGAMKLPDFSGLAGGKTTDLKGDGKGKGGFDNVLPFFVAPPAVNSSVTVYSTNAYSIDFFCAEVDDGNSGTEVVGFYVLDVKPPEKDFTFITSTELDFSTVQFDSIVLCQDMLQVVPAGTGFQCILSVGGGVPPDETDVIGATTDELTIKFEDGSQVVSGDEFGAVMLTGVEGNNTMMTEFGIPSSCAAFGELYVQVPKGQGFSVGPSSSSGGKTEEDKTPTGTGEVIWGGGIFNGKRETERGTFKYV
uniref:Jacalin-type lectin domain-containing protein n=1 Tax=Chromera velia CCMP2878 TaxID=1169474 RepID=A0A0G4FGR7_9ALVE|eukprot:Cvel_3302.t1-p1 / transcript=Cvel_3302.t1 / gene=Cvel_3302 / organism=Chromera_velia_CCMP2878 / gene_product=hypothetical protein / transcript_product=hypothetical protein / location=Cvel_scaffold131:27-1065(-) / protein_length=277 / sequence_SO=supercontig / SO=protein_coding / is_pseudo=false